MSFKGEHDNTTANNNSVNAQRDGRDSAGAPPAPNPAPAHSSENNPQHGIGADGASVYFEFRGAMDGGEPGDGEYTYFGSATRGRGDGRGAGIAGPPRPCRGRGGSGLGHLPGFPGEFPEDLSGIGEFGGFRDRLGFPPGFEASDRRGGGREGLRREFVYPWDIPGDFGGRGRGDFAGRRGGFRGRGFGFPPRPHTFPPGFGPGDRQGSGRGGPRREFDFASGPRDEFTFFWEFPGDFGGRRRGGYGGGFRGRGGFDSGLGSRGGGGFPHLNRRRGERSEWDLGELDSEMAGR